MFSILHISAYIHFHHLSFSSYSSVQSKKLHVPLTYGKTKAHTNVRRFDSGHTVKQCCLWVGFWISRLLAHSSSINQNGRWEPRRYDGIWGQKTRTEIPAVLFPILLLLLLFWCVRVNTKPWFSHLWSRNNNKCLC